MEAQAPAVGEAIHRRGGKLRRVFMCLALLSSVIGLVEVEVSGHHPIAIAPGLIALIVFGLPRWVQGKIW